MQIQVAVIGYRAHNGWHSDARFLQQAQVHARLVQFGTGDVVVSGGEESVAGDCQQIPETVGTDVLTGIAWHIAEDLAVDRCPGRACHLRIRAQPIAQHRQG